MQRLTNIKQDQKGFASIVIALIFIIVLALLTVGFATLARREQQTALDKQKATQASYAAESGINDALRDILSGKINVLNDQNGQGCINPIAGGYTANHTINPTDGVSYSCVIVQLNTSDLSFENRTSGTTNHINFDTSGPLTNLTIQWGSHNPNTNFQSSVPTSGQFTNNASWTSPAVVEVSLTPTGNLSAQSDENQYLMDNTFTVYLYPSSSSGGSVYYSTAAKDQGQVISGACLPNSGRHYPCAVTIKGLGGTEFVAAVKYFYGSTDLRMCANNTNCPSGSYSTDVSGTTFTGEPLIDVTGKARDVLKRFQARILLNNGYTDTTTHTYTPDDNAPVPKDGIQAQNICKRIQAAPAINEYSSIGSSYDTPSYVSNTTGAAASASTACNLSD